MSASRFPRLFTPPRPGSGEWTPLLLAIVLLIAAIAQFALPGGVQLPEASGLAPRRVRMPAAVMIPDYPGILRAPIFAPDRAPGEASATGGSTLDAHGPSLLGVAASGRSASAIVRGSDGATHVLRPGEALLGWRLISVEANAAVFATPGGRVRVQLGAPAPPPSPVAPSPRTGP
ncbi:MAG: hypothetical protein P4L64_14645 [Caulobacteraceae bacterium]|nr:hypothetical protein [Caulobacteraceae bacterium]